MGKATLRNSDGSEVLGGNGQRPTPSTRPEPLVEDKGLPPIQQTKPIPPVKSPKEESCKDHVNTQNNLVDIPIVIDGKTYTLEQAREIWEKLDEIFGETVVRQLYPVYPTYPVPNIWPDWTPPYSPYCGDTADSPLICWRINICTTESEE